MKSNEQIIRELFEAAEGKTFDMKKFVAMFSDDGYMWDMATGAKIYGQEIGEYLGVLTNGFPDIHREIHKIHAAGDVIIAEVSIQGKHTGDFRLPTGSIAPTGKFVNFPSCDVFRLEHGKIKSFHCYNEAAVMMRQLGLAG